MRSLFSFILLLLCTTAVFAQKNLDRTLKQLNSESVPYAYVNEVTSTEHIMILDTRQKEEFDVSHIENAIWVGHKSFEKDSVIKRIPSKETPIMVYCSIGVRSEDIGEKLLKAGYTDVKNLYGGIFEWKNQGNAVYKNNMETDSIHTFNKQWGKLLKKGVKVY
ncbi:MAG: rhodanese-like domain-containing protein [Maribacter sp.]